MGCKSSRLVSFFNMWGKTEVRILMQGLAAAGKTTILYKLKLGEVVNAIPTIGTNVETVENEPFNMKVFDVGGRDKIRPLLRFYYPNTDALIFVVDSTDRDRIELFSKEVRRTLAEDSLKDCLILFMANKQDLPEAMTVTEIVDKLRLHELRHKWNIVGTSAVEGQGLTEGLEWITDELNAKFTKQTLVEPIKQGVGESKDVITDIGNHYWTNLWIKVTSLFGAAKAVQSS